MPLPNQSSPARRRQSDNSNNRGGIWSKTSLAAASSGVIVIIGSVPRHLRHSAAVAEKCIETILSCHLLRDAVLGSYVMACLRDEDDCEQCHQERQVLIHQDQNQNGAVGIVRVSRCEVRQGEKDEGPHGEVYSRDRQQYAEGGCGLRNSTALVRKPRELQAMHDLRHGNFEQLLATSDWNNNHGGTGSNSHITHSMDSTTNSTTLDGKFRA